MDNTVGQQVERQPCHEKIKGSTPNREAAE